jgi:hypothetical protein
MPESCLQIVLFVRGSLRIGGIALGRFGAVDSEALAALAAR